MHQNYKVILKKFKKLYKPLYPQGKIMPSKSEKKFINAIISVPIEMILKWCVIL